MVGGNLPVELAVELLRCAGRGGVGSGARQGRAEVLQGPACRGGIAGMQEQLLRTTAVLVPCCCSTRRSPQFAAAAALVCKAVFACPTGSGRQAHAPERERGTRRASTGCEQQRTVAVAAAPSTSSPSKSCCCAAQVAHSLELPKWHPHPIADKPAVVSPLAPSFNPRQSNAPSAFLSGITPPRWLRLAGQWMKGPTQTPSLSRSSETAWLRTRPGGWAPQAGGLAGGGVRVHGRISGHASNVSALAGRVVWCLHLLG